MAVVWQQKLAMILKRYLKSTKMNRHLIKGVVFYPNRTSYEVTISGDGAFDQLVSLKLEGKSINTHTTVDLSVLSKGIFNL